MINELAMKLVKKSGGLLFSFTCSGSLAHSAGDFEDLLATSAKRAGRNAQIVFSRLNSPDHPYLASYLESIYLKACLLRIQ